MIPRLLTSVHQPKFFDDRLQSSSFWPCFQTWKTSILCDDLLHPNPENYPHWDRCLLSAYSSPGFCVRGEISYKPLSSTIIHPWQLCSYRHISLELLLSWNNPQDERKLDSNFPEAETRLERETLTVLMENKFDCLIILFDQTPVYRSFKPKPYRFHESINQSKRNVSKNRGYLIVWNYLRKFVQARSLVGVLSCNQFHPQFTDNRY